MKIKFKDFIKENIIFDNKIKLGNHKPAVVFDKIFGTTLSQQYKYPNNLNSDQVFRIIIVYLVNKKTKNILKFDKLVDILNKLDSYFPYIDMKNVTIDDKFNILYGMVSEFNYDDIIWFSVKHMIGSINNEINTEIEKLPYHIRKNIGWVLSPKTLKKLKTQLHIPTIENEKDFDWWD